MGDEAQVRVFICGGRDFRDAGLLSRILSAVDSRPGIARIVESGDRAGKFAAEWATASAVPVVTVHGDRMSTVGIARLAERIVAAGQPDLAIGFSGGMSTATLLEHLEHAGVRIRRIEAPGA